MALRRGSLGVSGLALRAPLRRESLLLALAHLRAKDSYRTHVYRTHGHVECQRSVPGMPADDAFDPNRTHSLSRSQQFGRDLQLAYDAHTEIPILRRNTIAARMRVMNHHPAKPDNGVLVAARTDPAHRVMEGELLPPVR